MDQPRVKNVTDKVLCGWLPVEDNKGNTFEIFYSTEVKPIKNSLKFEIIEGFHKGKIVHINFKAIRLKLFTSYFGKIPTREKCFIGLELKSKTLSFSDEKGRHEVIVQANNLEPGTYLIAFPDRRHSDKISKEYLSEPDGGSRFAETWFPIVKDKFEFKYLHYGRFSNGCATVISSGNEWAVLYNHIVTSRFTDCVHGHLVVVDNLSKAVAALKQKSLKKIKR